MKSANSCARKFESLDLKVNKEYFVRYCIKKAQQIIPEENIPSREEQKSMQKTLDSFQKMFYSEENSCNSNQGLKDV